MDNGLKIYALARTYGLTDFVAKCVAAQAGHETGGFTSKIFKSNNNAFGMAYYIAEPFAIGTKNGYANYSTIDASVAGFIYWWTKHRAGISFPLFINSLESYVSFLKNNNYFEDTESNYLKGCQYFFKQYFDE